MVAGVKSARALACLACAAAFVATRAAGAETMADPTRPPARLSAPDGHRDASGRPVLQSIIITPHRRSAIIDGERVDLRGRFGDAEVVQITESDVVLRSPGGTEILKLYPGVDKALRRAGSPRAATPVERRRGY